MPWTAKNFKSRHNKDLTAKGAAHAAKQANAILRSGAPEGIAIAAANKYAEKHDMKKYAEGGRVGTEQGTPEKRMRKDEAVAKRFGTKSRNTTGNKLTEAKDLGKKHQKPPGVRW